MKALKKAVSYILIVTLVIGVIVGIRITNEKAYASTKKVVKVTTSKKKASPKKLSRGDMDVADEGAAVVQYAKKFIGTPYAYGASGPSRFDCSGFTSYVYRYFGISLPHSSSGQSGYGIAVSKSNLQPGDLVFFGNGGIHHVGIYVGSGNYIHAPKTGDVVRIASLGSRSDFACARRVIR